MKFLPTFRKLSAKTRFTAFLSFLLIGCSVFTFQACKKENLTETTSTNQFDNPLTPDMVKSWFEAKYGSSKKISPPERQTRSVVGEKDLAYYFAETFQITPSWSNEQISTYLNKYPIVIVSVEPIEHLDARNFGYVLIFYRDSLNQIDGRLQVYDANPNYRKTHKTYDVKDFSGQFFQITLEGKVEKLLFINNGQIQLAAKLGTNSNTSTSTLKPRGLCSQCLNIYDEHRTPLENAWCWICELLHSDGGGGTTLIATTDPGFGPPNADLFNTNNYVGNTNYIVK